MEQKVEQEIILDEQHLHWQDSFSKKRAFLIGNGADMPRKRKTMITVGGGIYVSGDLRLI
jgi:hypothetical protein